MNKCRLAASTAAPGLVLSAALAAAQAEPVPPASPSASASIGWHSLGAMSAPKWDGKVLSFASEQGCLAITPLADDVIRVRFTPAKSFGRDHSYAVINHELGALSAKADVGANSTTMTTAKLKVLVQHNPLRISFANAAGESLDADDPGRGIAVEENSFRVAKRLRVDENIYGFGEKNGRLNKRGSQLGGYNLTMWNSDTYSHDAGTDPIYVSVPFYLVTRKGAAHGIFLDNTWRSTFDIGRERQDLLTFGAEGGDLDYYFINGPHPKQVIERYTALTGRMPLPPRWTLGLNQCRYSYFPESKVRSIADTFRQKRIPADVIWLDIHYQDNYKPFTWDKQRFPDPAKLVADLRAEGFHTVCIVDAHPKVEKGYAPYDSGIAGDHFIKGPDGKVFEGPVWPAHAEKSPGPSVFPDFSKPGTRDWWGAMFKQFTDIGIAGIWNDMNEPAVFKQATGTLPLDVVHDNEGQPTTHREIHNVYGQLMSRATFEGLAKLRPNERPFVLTRATYAGGQRYAAVWPGDNAAEWTSLRQSVSTLLGMGLSGFPFIGGDIGGYAQAPSPELFTRWMQVGVFSPFMRIHAEYGTPDKEVWSFGPATEALSKRAIELRYQLLPHIYNVMQQSSETGLPALRPLFLEFPEDETVASIDDQFMFGSDLLIAPVMREGVKERNVNLPKLSQGEWFDYWTGRPVAANEKLHVPVTIESIPVYVRGGAFVFRQLVVQNTDQMAGNALNVLVVPAKASSATQYEDDGVSMDYKQGGFMKRRFQQVRKDERITIEVSAPEGSYRPAKRDLVLEIWTEQTPKQVTLDKGLTALTKLDEKELAAAASGWSYVDGTLKVKVADPFTAMSFNVQ